MGFFEDVGETFFGTETRKRGVKAQKQATSQTTAAAEAAKQRAAEAAGYGKAYDVGAKESMGASAADYMAKQQAAAEQLAGQQAGRAAIAGSQAALQAARTAGLSKGQAALLGGQQAGGIYGAGYDTALNRGMDRYSQATGQFAQQGAEMASRGQQALGTQLAAGGQLAGIGGQQVGQAAQTAGQTWAGIGALAGGLSPVIFPSQTTAQPVTTPGGNLPSDERVKENIQDLTPDTWARGLEGRRMEQPTREPLNRSMIDELLATVKPVAYDYKQGETVNGAPLPEGRRPGVLAQDLEQSPMREAVKEAPDGTKVIDSAELAPMTLNAVLQLADRLKSIESALGLKGAE